MYDLPSEDPEEIRLPDEYHTDISYLLKLTFRPPLWDAEQVFCAIDLNIYYDVNHLLWYKRPDWFGVVGVPRLYEGRDQRWSYVMWQEQVSPIVVVEFLSPSTEDEDLGKTVSQPGKPPTKWQVYEQILGVPYYVLFSRYTNQLQVFQMVEGHYEPAVLTQRRLVIPELGLSLGTWQGRYQGIERLWLRWFTAEGELILSPDERATAAEQKATATEQKAIVAEQKATAAEQKAIVAEQKAAAAEREAIAAKQEAERLAARLRELEQRDRS